MIKLNLQQLSISKNEALSVDINYAIFNFFHIPYYFGWNIIFFCKIFKSDFVTDNRNIRYARIQRIKFICDIRS